MRVLFIGGTGLTARPCSERAVEQGVELWVLNRAASGRYPVPRAHVPLTGDVHGEERDLARLLDGTAFDAVVDWIAYTPEDIERDIRLFGGKDRPVRLHQLGSAYQTPPEKHVITEETPLDNPFWRYSRTRSCASGASWRSIGEGFPVTIVRPSHTYGPSQIPLAVNSWRHPWTAAERMRRGNPVIVHGDGTSLWVLTWNADLAVGLVGLLGRRRRRFRRGLPHHLRRGPDLGPGQTAEVGRALGVEPRDRPRPLRPHRGL